MDPEQSLAARLHSSLCTEMALARVPGVPEPPEQGRR